MKSLQHILEGILDISSDKEVEGLNMFLDGWRCSKIWVRGFHSLFTETYGHDNCIAGGWTELEASYSTREFELTTKYGNITKARNKFLKYIGNPKVICVNKDFNILKAEPVASKVYESLCLVLYKLLFDCVDVTDFDTDYKTAISYNKYPSLINVCLSLKDQDPDYIQFELVKK